MRSTRVPVQKQYQLILECRQSGLSDHQWCIEYDINPGTFYNWVKRLHQKGCSDLPSATGRCSGAETKQEVVKIDFKKTDIYSSPEDNLCTVSNSVPSAMNLSIGNCNLSIPNGTDSVLLAQTLKILMELPC